MDFGLRKVGLSRQESGSFPYLNSHFRLTKVRVCSKGNNSCKGFSSKNVISKHYLVTVVTVVTIKYSHLNNYTIYYYIYTYIIIDLKENVRVKITVTTVTERLWSTIKGI